MEFLLFLFSIALIYLFLRLKKLRGQFKKIETERADYKHKLNNKTEEFRVYKERTAYLQKYEVIEDAQKEAENILRHAESHLNEAQVKGQMKISEAETRADEILQKVKIETKSIKEKADLKLSDAHDLASKIEQDAMEDARRIAGEALEAKNKADLYASTVKAMKNMIKGYGDEYLIPNETLLDDLAEEYDHKQAGQDLKLIREQIKSMIKNDKAAECDYVDVYRKATAVNFVVDAFNGKVDTIMAKVKHNNYGKLKQKLADAYSLVNHNGKAFRNARITPQYFDLMEQQLDTSVILQEIKRQDREEQRRIREEMQEEERARREYEKAKKEALKEEKMLQKALKEAQARLTSAVAEEKEKFEQQLRELQEKLAIAEEKGQRAISMAQQTKRGHVYVISNIGSFGENVFKIGLTRRLEPMDRIKELGDASVPFSFDVHAMIFSEDAPRLEKDLHDIFNERQVNKVNYRKEFFRVSLAEIRAQIEALGLATHWTMKAEALEYRESLQLEKERLDQNLETSVVA